MKSGPVEKHWGMLVGVWLIVIQLCAQVSKKASSSAIVLTTGPGQWLSPCAWHCWGHTSSPVSTSGALPTSRTLRWWSESREEQWRWWRVWNTGLVCSGWESLCYLVWRKGDARMILSLSTASQKEAGVRWSLSHLPGNQWQKERTWPQDAPGNNTKFGLNSGRISSWKVLPIFVTGCSGKRWSHQPRHCSRNEWMWHLVGVLDKVLLVG